MLHSVILPNGNEFIPAFPDPRQRQFKEEAPGYIPIPNLPASVLIEAPDSPQWNAKALDVRFQPKTGELHWYFFGNTIKSAEFNERLAEVRKQYKDAVISNVLWLSRYTVEGQFGQLRVNGYERQEHRETNKNPMLAFVQSPARQWKD